MPRKRKAAENQRELAFMDAGRGEAPSPFMGGHEPQTVAIRNESPADDEHLMEEVCKRENLKEAYARVVSNKGSPGVDGMTVQRLGKYLRKHWPTIREQLLKGTYQPKPVRRVEIPKPDGGVRKLGIPTVIDRLIQQAMMQVLQLRWDPTFSNQSYGFRPGRSQRGAVSQAQTYIREGNRVVVDLDLEKFFDRVNHDILMDLVAKREADKRVLKVIRAFLTAGIFENGLISPSDEGTPQGGPLSPLLSNLMLDVMDRELEKRQLRFVRYADDCNIYVRSVRAGERIKANLTRFLAKRLRLTVNETKSAVDKPSRRKFLGFTFTDDEDPKRTIAPKPLEKFKLRIRELTRASRGVNFDRRIPEIRRYLVGWVAYFGFCETPKVLQRLAGWIRRRLRCLLWRQWKTQKNRFAELRRRGVNLKWARNTAASNRGPWHLSATKALTVALPNVFFSSLGLSSLEQATA